jgi:tRNA 2-thiouridine synthesizing protein A
MCYALQLDVYNKSGMKIAHINRGRLTYRCNGEKKLSGANLAEIVAAKVVDARDKACPGTLLEILEVLSNDPEARNDIRSWAEKAGQDYLGHMEAKGYDRLFVARRQ